MSPPDLLLIPTHTVAPRPLWVPQMPWSTAWKSHFEKGSSQCGHRSPEGWEFFGTRGGLWKRCWWSISGYNVSLCMCLSLRNSVTHFLAASLVAPSGSSHCALFLLRFPCRVQPPSAAPVLGQLARGTSWHVWTYQCYRKPWQRLCHPLSLSGPLPPLLPATFLAPIQSPIYSDISGTLHPLHPSVREMSGKVRIVASCDCSPPGSPSARGGSYRTEPLWARRVLGRREGTEGGKATRFGLPGAVPQW